MSTRPVYDSLVEHRPRFLHHGLPANGVTIDDFHALPEDPWWTYEFFDGALILTSDFRTFTWDDLQTFPDDPHWKQEVIDRALLVTRTRRDSGTNPALARCI
jgi:hypothetical protein